MATIQSAPHSLPLTSTYAPFSSTNVQAGATTAVRPSFPGGNNGVVYPGWNHFYFVSAHVYLPMRLPYSPSPLEQVSSFQGMMTSSSTPNSSHGQQGGFMLSPRGHIYPPGNSGHNWGSFYTCNLPTMVFPQHGNHYFHHNGVLPLPPQPIAPPPIQLRPRLKDIILIQLEYYFSVENLVKDLYLRNKMDEEGWVPINLVAGFRKVKVLTTDIQIILDALKHSSVVEVKGEKIRKRNGWKDWLLPSSFYISSLSRSESSDNMISVDQASVPS